MKSDSSPSENSFVVAGEVRAATDIGRGQRSRYGTWFRLVGSRETTTIILVRIDGYPRWGYHLEDFEEIPSTDPDARRGKRATPIARVGDREWYVVERSRGRS